MKDGTQRDEVVVFATASFLLGAPERNRFDVQKTSLDFEKGDLCLLGIRVMLLAKPVITDLIPVY
ncbi:MAG: hypothetical protein LBB04_01410 [Oscillospiraceae bacterium]|nr:hypothetical protein [Oscillospiraceae bacterium]